MEFNNEACLKVILMSKSAVLVLCDMVQICAELPVDLGFVIEF